jgi:hypothetical protein
MINRRGLLTGLGALFAAPAIVRVESIIPVRTPPLILSDACEMLVMPPPTIIAPDLDYVAFVAPQMIRDLMNAGALLQGGPDGGIAEVEGMRIAVRPISPIGRLLGPIILDP